MLRHTIERLARGTAIRRRLPAKFGRRPIYLSPDSALSYLKPRWHDNSQSLLTAVTKYATGASSVWDIGANCGVFSLAAAHVAAAKAEIVAVEADPFLAVLLQNSALDRANSDVNICVLCAAVSNRSGIDRFLVANRGRSSNSLQSVTHRNEAGGTRYMHYVPTLTLDNLLVDFRRPDIIKIDVEGAEAIVLSGADEVLSDVRPLLYVEVGQSQNTAVMDILRRYRYRIYDGDRSDEVVLDHCAFNTLAVPAESHRTNA